jgi:hypothetical protein
MIVPSFCAAVTNAAIASTVGAAVAGTVVAGTSVAGAVVAVAAGEQDDSTKTNAINNPTYEKIFLDISTLLCSELLSQPLKG